MVAPRFPMTSWAFAGASLRAAAHAVRSAGSPAQEATALHVYTERYNRLDCDHERELLHLRQLPFDDAYSESLDAIVFTIVLYGFEPRAAVEHGRVSEPESNASARRCFRQVLDS